MVETLCNGKHVVIQHHLNQIVAFLNKSGIHDFVTLVDKCKIQGFDFYE
jgi:hypothetical protein